MKKAALPKDVIDSWPEVFSDVEIKAIPLEYVYSIRVIFNNGKVWDVDIASYAKKQGFSFLEQQLQELLSNYDDSIEHIDFRLNVEKVKKDVIKKTRSFLKKPK